MLTACELAYSSAIDRDRDRFQISELNPPNYSMDGLSGDTDFTRNGSRGFPVR
jgi:hypothetical protein